MEFLCRIMKVQRHKQSCFLYVSGLEFTRQLIVNEPLINNYPFSPMSILKGCCEECINNKGEKAFYVSKIEYNSQVESGCDILHHSNRNIKYRRCYWEIIREIKTFLNDNGFIETYSPFTLPYRGTSIMKPLAVSGEYVNRYTKITHELGLKKNMASILLPVYELGYVACDTYITQSRWFEYSVIEFVSPFHKIDFVAEFIKAFITIATRKADEYGLNHLDMQNFEYVDLNNTSYTVNEFKEKRKAVTNTIFVNAPTDSPLVLEVEGKKKETIWILNGESMAHGYRDETNPDFFTELSNKQYFELKEKGIEAEISKDFLEVLRQGIPESVSLGMGTDRFFQKFFKFTSIKEFHSIIG